MLVVCIKAGELGGGHRGWIGGDWSRGFQEREGVTGLVYIGRTAGGAEGGAVVYVVGEPMEEGADWGAEEEGRSVAEWGRARGVCGRITEVGGMPEGGRGE